MSSLFLLLPGQPASPATDYAYLVTPDGRAVGDHGSARAALLPRPSGTGAEVTPVREIDGRPVGTGQPGPVTKRLQEAFYKVVRGPGEPRADWLHYL